MIVNQIILLRLILTLINLDSAVYEIHEIEGDGRTSNEQRVQQPHKEAKSTSEAEDSQQYVNLTLNAIHQCVGTGMKSIAKNRQCCAK